MVITSFVDILITDVSPSFLQEAFRIPILVT
jgi:hypothetical protein